MQRLSSNLTLFFKFFVPISWASFFGFFGMVIFFLIDSSDEPLLTSTTFKSVYVVFYIVFGLLLYFTLFKLKRVETKEQEMYCTNYFKTIKFPTQNIKRISTINLGIMIIARMHLHNKGEFGKVIPFITKRSIIKSFKQANPSIAID